VNASTHETASRMYSRQTTTVRYTISAVFILCYYLVVYLGYKLPVHTTLRRPWVSLLLQSAQQHARHSRWPHRYAGDLVIEADQPHFYRHFDP